MKIFFYTTSLDVGGAEIQCARIAEAMKVRGYDVEIIVTYPERSNERVIGPLCRLGIPIHGCCWKSFAGLRCMYRLFKSAGKDSALFCYNTFPDFLGGFIGKVAGVDKIYGSIRSEYLPIWHIVMDWIVQRLCLTGTIFNSRRARDKFVKRYRFSDKKSLFISNCIPKNDFSHNYGQVSCNGINVITVGTFKPPKDYRTWLEVVARARAEDVRIRGTIIGYGWQENDIRRWINELGLDDAVEIVDGNGKEDIPQRLAAADIYLSTSILEGTSNSILEALRAAIPVVVTDVGDNEYLVEKDETGFICGVRDIDSMFRKILDLVCDADLRKRMGNNARNRLMKNHSIDYIVGQYESLVVK